MVASALIWAGIIKLGIDLNLDADLALQSHLTGQVYSSPGSCSIHRILNNVRGPSGPLWIGNGCEIY